jgi:hypothetical protein
MNSDFETVGFPAGLVMPLAFPEAGAAVEAPVAAEAWRAAEPDLDAGPLDAPEAEEAGRARGAARADANAAAFSCARIQASCWARLAGSIRTS